MSILNILGLGNPRIFGTTAAWLRDEGIPNFAQTETSSTNEIAKAEAFSISEPFKVYVTDRQTAGRGRGTNTWSNPNTGTALMITFSFAVQLSPQPITAPLTGLAIYQTLLEVWPNLPISVKAPNDILLRGKKICGILVETVQMGQQHRLVIGVGLNVSGSPKGMSEAGCLADETWVNQKMWKAFLKKLVMHMQWVAQGSQAAHLSDTERAALLHALNQNPNLQKNYVSLSPFGDLVTDTETLSWRSL